MRRIFKKLIIDEPESSDNRMTVMYFVMNFGHFK